MQNKKLLNLNTSAVNGKADGRIDFGVLGMGEPWQQAFDGFFENSASKQRFLALQDFLCEHPVVKQNSRIKMILPVEQARFRAFRLTPPKNVKVVVLGQDPYPGYAMPGIPYAQGLAFSAPTNCSPPASLRNIIAEVLRDFGENGKKWENNANRGNSGSFSTQKSKPLNFDASQEESEDDSQKKIGLDTEKKKRLEAIAAIKAADQRAGLAGWADQGVFLLNTVLTVVEGQPGAHRGRGWEELTEFAIAHLAENYEHLVFMLWGAAAQQHAKAVEKAEKRHSMRGKQRSPHLVLSTSHPSPLSVYRGFRGCAHFSRANAYLQAHGLAAIDWMRGIPKLWLESA